MRMQVCSRQNTMASLRTTPGSSCSKALPVPSLALRPRAAMTNRSYSRVRCLSTGVDQPQQDLQTAEKRWEDQVRRGKIKNVTTSEANNLMQDGWVLLDVRPPNESEKVAVVGAVEVPLFYPDPDTSLGGLLKKSTAFGMGGWWLGGTHMVPNTQFMQQLQEKVPDRDVGVVIACQKGLRSLAAAEQLALAGYSRVAWINGGLDTCQPGDLPTSNGRDLRYAGIGGLSAAMGWTEVQQQEAPSEGPTLLLKLAGLVLAVDLLLFAYEELQYLATQGGQ